MIVLAFMASALLICDAWFDITTSSGTADVSVAVASAMLLELPLAAFNGGLSTVVNPSGHKGGTLNFDAQSTPDSFDPGNTYYAWVLNFDRLFVMPKTSDTTVRTRTRSRPS